MKHAAVARSARNACALLVGLATAGVCSAQAPEQARSTISTNQTAAGKVSQTACAANLEEAGYTVTHSEIDNPFDFLPWVHAKDQTAAKEISKLVDNQPFHYKVAVSEALEIINSQDFRPNTPLIRVRLQVNIVDVHCPDDKHVTLTYRVYSTQIAPSVAGTPEEQSKQANRPQEAAGLVGGATPYHLTPSAGFDATDKLFAGGKLTLDLCTTCTFRLEGIAEGQGSQQMASTHVALKGSRNSRGAIANSTWLVNYNESILPTGGAGQLRSAMGSLQVSATTHSFLKGNLSARFGGLLEKGDQQAQLKVPAAQAAMSATAVNALKMYGGLDSRFGNERFGNQVMAASFGLELGTTNVTSGVQWKKYFGDVRHDFWHSAGDHHSIEIESRFNVGAIQSGGPLPVPELFFGGSHEQLFMPDDSWQIRADPVIRAIPGTRFYETATGVGGNRFLSYNLTMAFAAWRKPVVPPEVGKNQKFNNLLDAQLKTATSMTQVYYLTLDQHYKNIVQKIIPDLLQALKTLNASVLAAKPNQDQLASKFLSCTSAIKIATNNANGALTSSVGYAYVTDLLRPPTTPGAAGGDSDDDWLTKVVTRCSNLVTALGGGSGIEVGPVKTAQDSLDREFGAISQPNAQAKAIGDMAFVRRTLRTLFHDANLVSIGPVAVFDLARISPSGPGVGGTRYGPGGGVRLELASSINFTAGYARNLSARPGEGSGAVFFSMGFRDLFH